MTVQRYGFRFNNSTGRSEFEKMNDGAFVEHDDYRQAELRGRIAGLREAQAFIGKYLQHRDVEKRIAELEAQLQEPAKP